MIYYQETSEINFIKDLITRYQDAPVKVFLGKDVYADASSYHATSFKVDQASAAVAHLNKTYNELSEVI